MSFADFFHAATGNQPYGYQCRLACGDKADPKKLETLRYGYNCTSRLIDIPTGLGKTAAVVLAWLWNRIYLGDEAWPRRLVYCLPMRTLVEQTAGEIERWLTRLADGAPEGNARNQLLWLKDHSPVILMGGEENNAARREWDIYPEKPAILIGTQDMLLSRALNRGYGMARARWPMHFALLNNDALWVMDEAQLMDVGLATSGQLQAFRNEEKSRMPHPSFTWWMSATLQEEWLESPEMLPYIPEMIRKKIQTNPADRSGPKWENVNKTVHLQEALEDKKLADLVCEKFTETGTTLIIVNTVKRAVAVHKAISKNKKIMDVVDIHLVHSRFRPCDRLYWRTTFLNRETLAGKPQLIVATQVVEAGVDISADVLITDLAPWTSLVQRFGRAARYGGQATVYVVKIEEKKAAPYDYEELQAAATELAKLTDVSIPFLEAFENSLSPEGKRRLYPYSPPFLLLRRELDELFDTTADLTGADLDISRFIRTGEENDCQIAWIKLDPKEQPTNDFQPSRDERCNVPLGDARKFVDAGKGSVWAWDYLERTWLPLASRDIYPGLLILARADLGGYSKGLGFDLSSKKPVPCVADIIPLSPDIAADAAQDDESLSETDQWQTIAEHGRRVADFLRTPRLATSQTASLLDAAALWHDIGKAHPAFVSLIKPDKDHPAGDIAKAPQTAWRKPVTYQVSDTDIRPGFRHELASTLALIDLLSQCAPFHEALLGPWKAYVGVKKRPSPEESDHITPIQEYLKELRAQEFNLLLYLVASHHGKVRGNMQAAPADQEHPVAKSGDAMPIRGIFENDVIPSISLAMPDGAIDRIPRTRLTLEPSAMGLSERTGASWAERCAALLDEYGPFVLAWLETLIRAADAQASK